MRKRKRERIQALADEHGLGQVEFLNPVYDPALIDNLSSDGLPWYDRFVMEDILCKRHGMTRKRARQIIDKKNRSGCCVCVYDLTPGEIERAHELADKKKCCMCTALRKVWEEKEFPSGWGNHNRLYDVIV